MMGLHPEIKSNLEIREYNKFNIFHPFRYAKRMHDKGLIIDNETMITGGRNIANGYFGESGKKDGKALPVFEDSDALITESPAVLTAAAYFDNLWNSKFVSKLRLYEYSGEQLDPAYCNFKEDFYRCEQNQSRFVKKVREEENKLLQIGRRYVNNELDIKYQTTDWNAQAVQVDSIEFLYDEVVGQKSDLKKPENNAGEQLYEAVAKAVSSVVIVTPYLVITPEHVNLFRKLKENNVEVTIMTNSKGSNDEPIANVGYEKTRSMALDAGVKIFEYQGPDTLHAKMVLIDRARLYIGSFNWNFRSQNQDREVGILAQLPEDDENPLASSLVAKFARILQKSCRVGADVCITDPNRNLEGLTQTEIDDLMNVFRLREQQRGGLYRSLFPILKKQL